MLKLELWDGQKSQKGTSSSPKTVPPEVLNKDTNDTYFNETNLNNVNRAGREEVVKNSKGEIKEYIGQKRYRSRDKQLLAREIAEYLEDDLSLGAFRSIVDKISEQKIRIFLSIIKDTYLAGKIKKNRGAMFISLAKDYAVKNNINLNFR